MIITAPTGLFDSLVKHAPPPAWLEAEFRRRYSLPPLGTRITLITVSENATFLVTKAGVPSLILRLQRPGPGLSPESVRAELDWVAALRRDTSIPLPAPLPTADGELLTEITGLDGSAWVAVAFEFVAGSVLEDLGAPPETFRAIGRYAARLHRHAQEWRRPPSFPRAAWSLEQMVGPSSRWGQWEAAGLSTAQRSQLSAAQSAALAVMRDAPTDRSHWGLIHADLRPSNILVNPADLAEITIIDFDDCGFGWYLYDFAAAITHYEHRPEGRAMAAEWLRGYQEQMPLSEAQLELAGALSLLRRLQMLGWLTTHRPEAIPADLYAEAIPGAVYCAQRYLEDPLWLTRAAT